MGPPPPRPARNHRHTRLGDGGHCDMGVFGVMTEKTTKPHPRGRGMLSDEENQSIHKAFYATTLCCDEELRCDEKLAPAEAAADKYTSLPLLPKIVALPPWLSDLPGNGIKKPTPQRPLSCPSYSVPHDSSNAWYAGRFIRDTNKMELDGGQGWTHHLSH